MNNVICEECFLVMADKDRHMLQEHGVEPSAEVLARIRQQDRAFAASIAEAHRQDIVHTAGEPIVSK